MIEIFLVVGVGVLLALGVIWVARVDRDTQREIRADLDRWGR